MDFSTVDPCIGKLIQNYSYDSSSVIENSIAESYLAHQVWCQQSLEIRVLFLQKLAQELRLNSEKLVTLMQSEMGKLPREGQAEVEKCAFTADYYANQSENFLKPRIVQEKNLRARIETQSLGVLLAIMPWNFPCWQLIRCAVPALLAGNVVLLKHSEVTAGTAVLLAQIFEQAAQKSGFKNQLLRNIRFSHSKTEEIIADPRIAAVTFTGSVGGGSQVAALAGKYLKKSVMELGGSDAYIVLEDADLCKAVDLCVQSRLLNCGQSCVSAKRFFVAKKVSDEFLSQMQLQFANTESLAPLAAKKFQTQLHEQVQALLKKEQVQALCGGILPEGPGAFYPPTILKLNQQSKEWQQEFFGPVACVWEFSEESEAVKQANNSIFGLGGALFSQDNERALYWARQLECGMVAINDFVKSDPRIPFGGVKKSGYGRELAEYGLGEFVNVKTITGV